VPLPARSWPKISIITPSYNQGGYLEETIRSIILQNYPNYELFIVDAGSKDNTLDVIRQYEPWITRWVSEPDRGQSHAIRKGLAWATGDIINWINSDDLVAPGAFTRIAAEFDLARYDVLCGNCDYFVDELSHLDLRNERMGLGATLGDIFVRGKINQPSTFFKASVLKELDVDEQFHYAMDLDLWYRYLLRAGQQRVLLSNSLLTYFRLHGASKSVADSPRFAADINKVAYNILHSFRQPPVLLDYLRAVINDERFTPAVYPVNVAVEELTPFIRHQAWQALIYYNEQENYAAARQCLAIARRCGQPMSLMLLRQVVKLRLLPTTLAQRLARRP